jgi:hypothetical protein
LGLAGMGRRTGGAAAERLIAPRDDDEAAGVRAPPSRSGKSGGEGRRAAAAAGRSAGGAGGAALSAAPSAALAAAPPKVPAAEVPAEVLRWLQDAQEVMVLAAGGNDSAEARQAAKARSKELATIADVTGVSFKGRAFQSNYLQEKLARRGLLLYQVFRAALTEAAWAEVGAAFRRELCRDATAAAPRARLNVLSVGGGPGTDAAGLAWANEHFLRFNRDGARLNCALLDLEPQWKAYVQPLGKLMAPKGVDVSFHTCDVTAELAAGTVQGKNKGVAELVQAADLLVFSYVCNETSLKSQQSGWTFYKSLATLCRPGALLLFADVMQHSQPALAAVSAAVEQACAETGRSRRLRKLAVPPDHRLQSQLMVLCIEQEQPHQLLPPGDEPAPRPVPPLQHASPPDPTPVELC